MVGRLALCSLPSKIIAANARIGHLLEQTDRTRDTFTKFAIRYCDVHLVLHTSNMAAETILVALNCAVCVKPEVMSHIDAEAFRSSNQSR